MNSRDRLCGKTLVGCNGEEGTWDKPVAFSVFEPPLSNTGKLSFEPTRNDVHGDTALRVMVNACNLLSCNCGIPRPWE